MRSTAVFLMIIAAAAAGCSSSDRKVIPADQLVEARRRSDEEYASSRGDIMGQMIDRIEKKSAATTQPATLDILVISGGGDWGAFGAGVLKGWGKVHGDMARPTFDIVTGVSTGALIAPFAFIGDDDAINRVVDLYRSPKSDWVTSRGLFYFLPNNPSFYTMPGLERDLNDSMGRAMIQRIVDEGATGRELFVNTTNIDYGEMRAWDIVEESKLALAKNDEAHVRKILLASAGIPAVFPARELGDCLYVDGAVTSNILYGGRLNEDQTFPAVWQAKHKDKPIPVTRYWIIFNNQLRFPPQTVQQRWPDIMARAQIMATQNATVNSMRHLFAIAELSKYKRNAEVQVRIMSVPEDWIPANMESFNKDVMNELTDMGEKMGADPSKWRTESP